MGSCRRWKSLNRIVPALPSYVGLYIEFAYAIAR